MPLNIKDMPGSGHRCGFQNREHERIEDGWHRADRSRHPGLGAHLMIALCRPMNIPACHATGTGRDAADVAFATLFGGVRSHRPTVRALAVEDEVQGLVRPHQCADALSTGSGLARAGPLSRPIKSRTRLRLRAAARCGWRPCRPRPATPAGAGWPVVRRVFAATGGRTPS